MLYIEKLAKIIARQYNLEVVFEGTEAKTDGKKVYLPYIVNLTPEFEDELIGLVHHEAGHCLFTDFSELKRIKTRLIFMISNILEDYRIEKLMKLEYAGASYFINNLNKRSLERSKDKDWSQAPEIQRFLRALCCDCLSESYSYLDLSPKLDNLIKEISLKREKLTSTKLIITYAEEISTRLSELLDNSSKEKEELNKKMLSESLAMEPGQNSSGSSFEEEFLAGIDEEKDITFREIIKKEKINQTNSFSERKYSLPTTTSFDEEVDLSKTSNNEEFQKIINQVKSLVLPIRERLERSLLTYKRNLVIKGKTRGRVNCKVLGSAEVNENMNRIFKQTLKSPSNEVVVSILGDLSGSMSGKKVSLLKETTLAMALVMEALDIPFEILGFNDVPSQAMNNFSSQMEDLTRFNRTQNKLRKYIFKSFDTKSLFGISLMEASGSNPDGEALSWAASRLQTRGEKRKILLVLSDGQPASDGDDSILCSDLKRRIEELRKNKIECIGIGINSIKVQEFYKDFLVIKDLEELPRQATNKLAAILLRNLI